MLPSITIVLGIDDKHVKQLELVLATWRKHKPSLLTLPVLAFVDSQSSDVPAIASRVTALIPQAQIVLWPKSDIDYGAGTDKWTNPQRHKMLAGFLYSVFWCVTTDYWLKIDTDAIATGMDDWIDERWFADKPLIVAPPWPFTKPADQMTRLDEWAAANCPNLPVPALKLRPVAGAESLRHPRVCGWCDFFRTDFTKQAASLAFVSVGNGKLPVQSLDGYLWYLATRMGGQILRVNMKQRGWNVRNSMKSIRNLVEQTLRTEKVK